VRPRAHPLTIALVLVLARGASAEPNDGAVREAREHYERGLREYNLGELDGAIAEFKAAYVRSEAPGLLFNLAQAYRLKRDTERALLLYRSYLRALPNAPNRADAEARIAELAALVERPAPAPAALAPSAQPIAIAAAPSARRPGRPLVISGLAVGAAGVVALAVGVALGVDAQGTSDQLSRLAAQRGAWSDGASRAYQSAAREATAATVLDAVGGVAAGTGVLLTLLGVRANRVASKLAVTPSSGGARVVATWNF